MPPQYALQNTEEENLSEVKMEENKDVVKPKHYTNQLIETIHILDDLNLPRNLERAVEYSMRANRKNGEQDLLKALWYLIRHLIIYYGTSPFRLYEVAQQSVKTANEYLELKEQKQ